MFSVARRRLTIVFTLALFVILGISGFVVYLTTDAALYEQVDNNLEEQALHEQEFMVVGGPRGPGEGRGPGEHGFDERFLGTEGYFFALVDTDGEIINSSPSLDTAALASSSTLEAGLAGGHGDIRTK